MKLNELLVELLLSAGAFLAAVEPADAHAHPLSIDGNGWVVLLIIFGFVAVIYMLIIGSLKVEERDARLGRREDGSKGWIGVHRDSDDDDGHHSMDGHSH